MATKKKDPDYQLNIFHHFDETIKKNVIVFLVQTTKIFVSFRYEILLEDALKRDEIHLRIMGLHVPEVLIPQSGPALGRRQYLDMFGTYTLVITKQDSTVNEFHIRVLQEKVVVEQKPNNPFILVLTDPVLVG